MKNRQLYKWPKFFFFLHKTVGKGDKNWLSLSTRIQRGEEEEVEKAREPGELKKDKEM